PPRHKGHRERHKEEIDPSLFLVSVASWWFNPGLWEACTNGGSGADTPGRVSAALSQRSDGQVREPLAPPRPECRRVGRAAAERAPSPRSPRSRPRTGDDAHR